MPKRKRILYLITGLKVGGAEVLVRDLAFSLRKEHDITVACLTHPAEIYRELKKEGIPTVCLGMDSFFLIPLALWRFLRLLTTFKPNLIHTHEIHADLIGRLGKLLGIPVVSTVHVKLLERPYLLWYDRLTSFLVDRYITVSGEVGRFTRERLRLPAGKVMVIPNGIDLAKFGNVRIDKVKKRASIGVSVDHFVVGCVANFRPQKGHTYLLEAWSEVVRHFPSARLVLVGSGPTEENVRQQAQRLGVNETVLFLGQRDDVPELLKTFDLFVLPSLYEGLPLSLVEAMAAGCPVIATDIPENRDVLGAAGAGKMVTPQDPAALADAIMQTIDNQQSIPNRPDLRQFAWPTYLAAHKKLYQSL